MLSRFVKGTRLGLLLAGYPVVIYLLLSFQAAWPGALLGEYLWRRIAFPGLEIAPLGESIRSMVNNGHRIWEQDKHGSA